MRNVDWRAKIKLLGALARQSFRRSFISDLAIDLGTTNTLIYMPGRGIVLNEPSVIAFSARNAQVVALGHEAKLMIGRAPASIRVVPPLREGVIAHYEAAEKMLAGFIRRVYSRSCLLSPRLLICVPGQITQVERRAVEEAAYCAGARQVTFIEEPVAAAAGAGLGENALRASMVIDIGGGTTDIAVLSPNGLIHLSTLRLGGVEMDRAIARYLRQGYSLEVGEGTAESLKLAFSSSAREPNQGEFEVGGWSLIKRMPAKIVVRGEEIQAAVEPVVKEIIRAVQATLEILPPEVSADLLDSGLVMTGGGAQFPGLPEQLNRAVGLKVRLASEPLLAVVRGAGRLLEQKVAAPQWPLVSAAHTPGVVTTG